MKIHSIEWHEGCLLNLNGYIARQERFIQNSIENLNSMKNRRDFLAKQIEEAKKKKKDSFDPEKFLKKKQKSNP